MGRERKSRTVRFRYRAYVSVLICLVLLTGCSRKTENMAVQDTIPDVRETVLDVPGDASCTEETAAAVSAAPEPASDTENMASAAPEPASDTENMASAEPEPARTRDTGSMASAEPEPASDTEAAASAEQEPARDVWEPEQEQSGTQQHLHSFTTAEIVKQPDCVEQGIRKEICTICGAARETAEEALGHNMTTQWYGDPPDCTHGGYQAVLCTRCGWVDEEACGNVPALEHIPAAEEIQHGNCREDTIIIYTCSQCGEQTGYDRHTEPDEHKWVWKDTLIWDEETCEFQTIQIECCERCNIQP